MDYKALENIFIVYLKNIYSSEYQMVEALPKLIKLATNDEIMILLKSNLDMAKKELAKIEGIFKNIPDENPWGENANALEGFIEEIDELLEEGAEAELFDAELISICRKIKYFEISNYETAITYSQALGRYEDADLLQQSLNEKQDAKENLLALSNKIVTRLVKV